MSTQQLFDVLAAQGHKQRWLLNELQHRGYRFSEAYLSKIKSGARVPSRRFVDAVCETLGMAEDELFTGVSNGETRAAPTPRPQSNGRKRRPINVAIVGLGNCASSLVQGVHFYRDAGDENTIPGLMHPTLGGYHISDVNFVAAFDIDANKVGKDISEAIFAPPNNTFQFTEVPRTGVRVSRGMTHDGVGKYLEDVVQKAPGSTADIVSILKETKADVVVNYLPVGSEAATRWYVEQVLAAGCAFVNCIPVFIAREEYWEQRFRDHKLPIIGDDIKSQVGSTIIHRVLTRLFRDRGVRLDRTYQLNFGGNTDFLNMLERERLISKKISKTNAVASQIDYEMPGDAIHIGPSDHVPWLDDRKWAYIRMEGTTFGNVPLNVELKLEVWDSPNSAGVVIDAIRCCKLALDRGISGALSAPSAYFMKSPPTQYTDDEARDMVEEFIAGA
ncbi:MAG: inositol-3-phosphate synthase [Dehalococcoidia bacterium]